MGGSDGVADVSWPVIRWVGGKDDRFFAIVRKNSTLSVYETHLFGEKPIKVDDVVDMSWSLTESILALVLKGCGKQPGMVELRHTDLPDVYDLDCKMYWQSNGEYLAVKVDSVFVLFRIKEIDIPIEVLKVDEKVLAFAWEPSGHRFAMIHGGDQSILPDVSFYSMQNLGKVSKLATFNDKQADALFWSPQGKHIVLAELKGSFNGQFVFFDVDKLETMNKAEHLMATDIAWDPTGRYVATAYTISQEMEEGFKKGFHWERVVRPPKPANGFFIWSFKGEKLYWRSTPKEYRLLQLNWRPYGGSIDDEMLKNLEKPSEEESENSASEEESENSASEEEFENLASEEESESSESEEESENLASEEEFENSASEEESYNMASEEESESSASEDSG